MSMDDMRNPLRFIAIIIAFLYTILMVLPAPGYGGTLREFEKKISGEEQTPSQEDGKDAEEDGETQSEQEAQQPGQSKPPAQAGGDGTQQVNVGNDREKADDDDGFLNLFRAFWDLMSLVESENHPMAPYPYRFDIGALYLPNSLYGQPGYHYNLNEPDGLYFDATGPGSRGGLATSPGIPFSEITDSVDLLELYRQNRENIEGLTAHFEHRAHSGIGLDISGTQYRETCETGTETLDFYSGHLLLNVIQRKDSVLGLGVGGAILSGLSTHRGTSIKAYLDLYPGKPIVLRAVYTAAIINDRLIEGYEAKALIMFRNYYLMGGYRKLKVFESEIEAPTWGIGCYF